MKLKFLIDGSDFIYMYGVGVEIYLNQLVNTINSINYIIIVIVI